MRKLEKRNEYAESDIIKLIQTNDLSDINTFLVFNGGTGLGKSRAVVNIVKQELEKKFSAPQSLLLVESRTAMVNQTNIEFPEKIETVGGIQVCQRISFMNEIKAGKIEYDWVVIDECHGLFSEANFAQDAEFIANWIRTGRIHSHIIFITANDEYFDDLSRKYFPNYYNFIYLFPDFTCYYAKAYVKQIQFIKTNRTETTLESFIQQAQGQKGIIFLKKAGDVKDWFFKLLATNHRVGMIVSQANETSAALSKVQEKQAQDFAINISNGKTGITMADLCELYDTIRVQAGKESIREAIHNQHIPDDIDILLATDTIQEGISIKSLVDYIIIEGYTEVEVRQKLGRFRGTLNLLRIIFNPVSEQRRLDAQTKTYTQLLQWVEEDNQVALAEFYGEQQGLKSNFIFILKQIDPVTKQTKFTLNQPAFLNYQRNLKNFYELRDNTNNAVSTLYSYPLLEGAPEILNYSEDIRNFNLEMKVRGIADKWRGVPLKGTAQELLLQDFQDNQITDKKRNLIKSFKGICACFDNYQIETKSKKATKKDIETWPQYLNTTREEFKYIV